MKEDRNRAPKIVHPLAWLWEPMESDPTFVLRPMFGSQAAYVGGKLCLCFSAKAEPWRGVLVCTDKSRHEELIADFPALVPHPTLPKWLYLSETAKNFDAIAEKLVTLVRRRDSRIGVEPSAHD